MFSKLMCFVNICRLLQCPFKQYSIIFCRKMLRHNINDQFSSAKMQQNALYFHSLPSSDKDYDNEGTLILMRKPFIDKSNRPVFLEGHKKSIVKEEEEDVLNLEDIWQSVEQEKRDEKSKIRIELMNIAEKAEELTVQELEEIFGKDKTEKETCNNQCQEKKEEVEDLNELWDQVEDIHEQKSTNACLVQSTIPSELPKLLLTEKLSTQTPKKQINIEEFNILDALNGQQPIKGTNLRYGKDFMVYDYQSFALNCFETNIHSYFGFYESKKRNHYFLYDLITKQPLIECYQDAYEDININNPPSKKGKIDYETEHCLKFRVAQTKEHIATCFHKYINNGILYNLKPFNFYQRKYEDSFALVEITDGFIGNNCYCNTNVFISQKYTSQPGKLKMIIGMKNGFLIANMGVNGVKSAPYNCRLQNDQSSFVYLLGLIDKQSQSFIVRVGQGMSPLLSFAISVGRKRYIDSFREE